jgi:hypothetical protein
MAGYYEVGGTALWRTSACPTASGARRVPSSGGRRAYIEAFNSTLWSDCLKAHWSLLLQDGCKRLVAWHRHLNNERPHTMIGNISPIMPAPSAHEISLRRKPPAPSGPSSGRSASPGLDAPPPTRGKRGTPSFSSIVIVILQKIFITFSSLSLKSRCHLRCGIYGVSQWLIWT